MKFLLVMIVFANLAIAETKEKPKSLEHKMDKTAKAVVGEKAKEVLKSKEDCKDKVEKKIEIKPEAISLGGNTGCSLEGL
jgi:hypothetical protein